MNHFYVIGFEVSKDPADGVICKLGYARDVKQRLGQLQIGNHNKLVILGTNAIENAKRFEELSHLAFKDNLLRGEWYHLYTKDVRLLYDNMDNARKECECKSCT